MRSTKVLVVEDDVGTQLAVRQLLDQRGYTLKVAENGKLGVESAAEWLPDVILMDVQMPVMDGFTAATEIRKDPRTRRIPIIATTARDQPTDYMRGLMAGFNKYVTKPYEGGPLLEVLDEVVRQQQRRLKLEALALKKRPLEQLVQLSRDREQIFGGLLTALRKTVHCDVFAIHWIKDVPHLLVLVDAPEEPPGLLAEVERRLIAEGAEASSVCRVVCTGGESPIPNNTMLKAGLAVPLSRSDLCVGLMFVGSFERDAFGDEEKQALADLSPMLIRVFEQGLDIVLRAEPDVDDLVREVKVLLLRDDEAAEPTPARLESVLDGVTVVALASTADLDAAPADAHIALVEASKVSEFEEAMFERARSGGHTFPLVTVDRTALGDSDERLVALVFMGILIGFMDARRTGCLHILQRDGDDGGVIVFHKGRIAWASRRESDASLVGFLVSRSGLDRATLKRAIQRSLAENRSIAEVLNEAGDEAAKAFRAALKDYLVAVVGELLQIRHPRLRLSEQVVAARHNVTFDVDDITIEVFAQ